MSCSSSAHSLFIGIICYRYSATVTASDTVIAIYTVTINYIARCSLFAIGLFIFMWRGCNCMEPSFEKHPLKKCWWKRLAWSYSSPGLWTVIAIEVGSKTTWSWRKVVGPWLHRRERQLTLNYEPPHCSIHARTTQLLSYSSVHARISYQFLEPDSILSPAGRGCFQWGASMWISLCECWPAKALHSTQESKTVWISPNWGVILTFCMSSFVPFLMERGPRRKVDDYDSDSILNITLIWRKNFSAWDVFEICCNPRIFYFQLPSLQVYQSLM